jgi:hypothetical protein
MVKTLLPFEVAIDSDNNNGFDLPDLSQAEDEIEEDLDKPGKIIVGAPGADTDGDGVPDFAEAHYGSGDGDNTVSQAPFTPIVFETGYPVSAGGGVKLHYSASDPRLVTKVVEDDIATYTAAPGAMRLWTKPAHEPRNPLPITEGGDYIPPDVTLDMLFKLGERSIQTAYIEMVNGSGLTPIHIEWRDYHGGTTYQAIYFRDTVLVTLIPVELAVDANRDGVIKYAGNYSDPAVAGKPADTTTQEKPFWFWVNDDDDVSADGDENDADSTTKDCTNDAIDNKRDLEDFTRLWFYIGGLHEAISQGNIQVGLKWKNVTSGTTPAIKLYESVEVDGGTKYLTEGSVSQNQILLKEAITFGNGQTKITGTGTFVFPSQGLNNLFADLSATNPKKYFIFEGAGRGKGQLVMVFLKDGHEIGESSGVWLDLKDIKEMYENWTVGDSGEPSSTANRVTSFATDSAVNSFSYPSPQNDEEKDYVLLVHGWNMYPKEKERWTETMFKRLWQQNYKGRVGVFRWPTLTDDTISWGSLNPFDDADGAFGLTYDPSEFKAWKSGSGLLNCLNQLNAAGYSGRVRLIAHSMGNVVATEALRQAGGVRKVHTYVAAQAAMPVHCYDAAQQSLSFGSVPPFPTTPNIYAHYWESGQSDQFPAQWTGTLRSYAHSDYMTGGAGRYVNFYNEQDYALRPPRWELNQRMKPNNDYDYTTGLGFHYNPFNPFNARGLKFPADRYEIFAFVAEGRSRALGRQGGVGGVFNANQVNLGGAPYNFGSEHKYHSGQFRSNIAERWKFWEQFLIETGLRAAQ